MALDQLTQVLPIYDRIEDQLHRQTWHKQKMYDLLSPTDRFLPFQFNRPTDVTQITSIKLISKLSDLSVNDTILAIIDPSELSAYNFSDDVDRFMYRGQMNFDGEILLQGEYYLEITLGVDEKKYSEVFRTVSQYKDMTDCYKRVTFGACSPTLDSIYGDDFNFYNEFYIDGDLTTPDYEFDVETEEDGLKEETAKFQRYSKVHRLQILIPEYLADFLNAAGMYDTIDFELETGETFRVKEWSPISNTFQEINGYDSFLVEMVVKSFVKTRVCSPPIVINPTDEEVLITRSSIIADEEEFFLGGFYCEGEFTLFEQNEKILIFDDESELTGAVYLVTSLTGFGWDKYTLDTEFIVLNFTKSECTDRYWLTDGVLDYRWYDRPVILSKQILPGGNYRIKGVSFPVTLVTTFLNEGFDIDEYSDLTNGIGFGTDDEFRDIGIEVEGTQTPDTTYWVKGSNLSTDFGYSYPYN